VKFINCIQSGTHHALEKLSYRDHSRNLCLHYPLGAAVIAAVIAAGGAEFRPFAAG
jgi:hypothetical protein